MRFVIDETSWRFDGLAAHVFIEAMEIMLDQLDEVQALGHSVCYSDELFNTTVWQDKSFYDLYSPDSPFSIPREIQERIASTFYRLSKWQEMTLPWPPSFDIETSSGDREFAPSIAWAHEQTVRDVANAVACVVFSTIRLTGSFIVTVDIKSTPLWFVADPGDYWNFFRWFIEETTERPAEMKEMAASAFPALDFVEGAFNGIKDMSNPYHVLVRDLVHHLSVLSDHGERIFLLPWVRAEAEFGALGVSISDENGKTKADSEARKQRTIIIDGTETIFWWHTKLKPHEDRIHVYPDRITKGGRLLVGIFCRHLKT